LSLNVRRPNWSWLPFRARFWVQRQEEASMSGEDESMVCAARGRIVAMRNFRDWDEARGFAGLDQGMR